MIGVLLFFVLFLPLHGSYLCKSVLAELRMGVRISGLGTLLDSTRTIGSWGRGKLWESCGIRRQRKVGDGRIFWLFIGGIYSFSAKLFEMLVSHRHCETLSGSSIFSQKSNVNVRGHSVLGMGLSITAHGKQDEGLGVGLKSVQSKGELSLLCTEGLCSWGSPT